MKINSLPRALLLGLIGVYRQCFAGRGPFRNVRCTFGRIESCSAFGKRVARDAPSTWAAIWCILRRMRRCRDLSLFRLPGDALGWGQGYDPLVRAPSPHDAVVKLDDALERAGENARVRAAVGEAALLVLSHSGRVCRGGFLRSALLVRDASAVRRSLARRFYSRGAMSLFFAGLAAAAGVAGAGNLVIAPFVGAAVLTAASAWAALHLMTRVNRLEILAAIEGPFAQGKPTFELALGTPPFARPAAR